MKLIIQIPCYNEEQTLSETIADLPVSIDGISSIEILVIDDGSTDKTVEVAKQSGADHIISNTQNLGLAKTFKRGLQFAITHNADIIVNTDADNQYKGQCIAKLVEPIIAKEADISIGTRPILKTDDFSAYKKLLQLVGSQVVRMVSNTHVKDAPSGFRAFSRSAAKQINVFSEYTYTLETIIQAGLHGFSIKSVPIETNRATRPSRLVKNIPSYVGRSVLTILRIFATYKPFFLFASVGTFSLSVGFCLGLRFLIFYLADDGQGHVQSLILAAILLLLGTAMIMMAFIADLISVNRRLLEDISLRVHTLEERKILNSTQMDTDQI